MKKIIIAFIAITLVSSLWSAALRPAKADEIKTLIGKITEVIPVLFPHGPRWAYCSIMVVSDGGEISRIFIQRATVITDLNGKNISNTRPGQGERVEAKYSTINLSGIGDRNYAVSIRYVPLNYTQQSKGPAAPPLQAALGAAPAGKAAVYLYRLITRQDKMPFEVNINGKVEITLAPGVYYAYFMEPGNIEFKTFETGFGASKSVSSISLDAKAGQAYYLKGSDSKWGGHAHLEPVSPQAGADGIVKCKMATAQ